MKKKNEDSELDDTNKEAEQAEKERQEAAQAEVAEANRKFLEQERKNAEVSEKLARTEGALEAIKSFQASQGTKAPEWTKEQWEEFEEKTGLKKETLNTIDNVFGAKLKDIESKFEARTRQAEERAKAAEDKYNAYEGKRSFENQTKDYLSKKPQFARYEKDFNEFVNEYPEEVRKDPVKLAKIFDRAEIYIKGKVGEKEMRRTTGGSDRFGSDNSESSEEEFQADLSDLRGPERLTVERILPTREKEKQLRENSHYAKGDDGVMINARLEWDKYKK